MAIAAQKGQNEDDALGGGEGGGQANIFGNISVTSFYVAKRAAFKMKLFTKQYRDRKTAEDKSKSARLKEEELALKASQKAEQLKI